MEIKQYLLMIKKWAWLLIVGAVVGGPAGYFYSNLQPVLYQTSTKIMVSSAQQQDITAYFSAFNDIQLAKSYSQIINNDEIRQTLYERLGYQVHGIGVVNPSESNFIILTITDGDPQHAAETANLLVEVFVEYNYRLQDKRYKDTEDTLQKQISQVEEQIDIIQSQISEINEDTLDLQRQQIEEQTKQIDQMLSDANQELIMIEAQIEGFIPTPEVTNTPQPSWIIPTATSVPVPTPTLSTENLVIYRDLQARRDQLTEMRELLQKAYGDLLVNKAGSNFDPAMQQAQIQNTLALYQQIHSNLLGSYENVRLDRLRSTPNIMHVEKATVPGSPIQPRPMRSAMIGALAGFMLMGGIAFLIEYMDDTLKTTEDINNFLQLPVLGLIGEMPQRKQDKDNRETGIFVVDKPISPISEGFRTLRSNLEFVSVDKPIRVLEITSPSPSEGKSTVAINLAASIAQGGRRVILVDADFRRPYIHRLLNFPNLNGLVDLFRDPYLLGEVMQPFEGLPLNVITTGKIPPNPAELLASERMEKILQLLLENSDIVVLDTPPTILSDPVVLSAKVDGVLIVIRPGETKIGTAQVMMDQLKLSHARILGVVLNPINRKYSSYYTKYNYYSYYYYGSRSYQNYSEDGSGEKRLPSFLRKKRASTRAQKNNS